jgi:hypothetical protein
MPLNRHNTNVFHRTLYGGILKTIQLLKRGDDQKQGTVVAYTLFECRRSNIQKKGETIQAGMSDEHRTTWQIPRTELDRNGIAYLNPLDRIVERSDADSGPNYNLYRYWQPESSQTIDIDQFENYVFLECIRIDPPGLRGTD